MIDKQTLLLSLASALVGVGGWFGWQYFTTSPQFVLSPSAPCSLEQHACVAENKRGERIEVSFIPLPIPTMQDVTFNVVLQGIVANAEPYALVEGTEMYMGFQRVPLTNSVSNKPNILQGKTIFPICTDADMHWKITIAIPTASQTVYAVFALVTHKSTR